MQKGSPKICDKGHRYYKSSDCPTCPVCEEERKPSEGFLSLLSAPARRALENEGLISLKKIAARSISDLLKLHGLGPSTIKHLRELLEKEDLRFEE